MTETELQVFFVPCPPEREASFRHGLMMLYDWLEELSKQNKEANGLGTEAHADADGEEGHGRDSRVAESAAGERFAQDGREINVQNTRQKRTRAVKKH